jgi:hypothetical protein
MLRHKIIPLAWLFLACTIIGAAAGIGTARADSVQNYLDALHSRGISAGHGDGTLVAAGQEVCDYIADGYTPMKVAEKVYYATDSTIGAEDAGFIVGAAIANLCPVYLDLI